MTPKKSQVSMEFLINYGWVLVIVLIIVAFIAYFFFLNPVDYIQKRCDSPTGLKCLDFEVYPEQNKVVLYFQNNLGESIENFYAFIPNTNCVAWNSTGYINNYDEYVVEINNCPITSGKLDLNIVTNVQYKGFGNSHLMTTHLVGKVGDISTQSNSEVGTGTPITAADCPSVDCKSPYVSENACFYNLLPESTPCTSGFCDSNGVCRECISDGNCATLYGDPNWDCIDNICDPIPVAEGSIYSSYYVDLGGGSIKNYIDTLNNVEQAWQSLGYWILISGSSSGCVLGKECSSISSIPLASTCLNYYCEPSPYGCIQIPPIIKGTLSDFNCNSDLMDLCSGTEKYEIYINQQACTRAAS
jgi:uncharacterized protein (UPF0333 family)